MSSNLLKCDWHGSDHRRHSIRWAGYDYATPGAYFITICTRNRQCLLGEIRNGIVGLAETGCMVWSVWQALSATYEGVEIDAFVVMPNHFHGIVCLLDVGAGPRARPSAPPTNEEGRAQGPAPTERPRLKSLPEIMQRFKSLTTARWRAENPRTHPHSGTLWQRGYWDRVVRDDREMLAFRQYIVDNPTAWELDDNHPSRMA